MYVLQPRQRPCTHGAEWARGAEHAVHVVGGQGRHVAPHGRARRATVPLGPIPVRAPPARRTQVPCPTQSHPHKGHTPLSAKATMCTRGNRGKAQSPENAKAVYARVEQRGASPPPSSENARTIRLCHDQHDTGRPESRQAPTPPMHPPSTRKHAASSFDLPASVGMTPPLLRADCSGCVPALSGQGGDPPPASDP
jgi:hypothetical protein